MPSELNSHILLCRASSFGSSHRPRNGVLRNVRCVFIHKKLAHCSFHVCSACCMVCADVNFANGGDGDGISSVTQNSLVLIHHHAEIQNVYECNALKGF